MVGISTRSTSNREWAWEILGIHPLGLYRNHPSRGRSLVEKREEGLQAGLWSLGHHLDRSVGPIPDPPGQIERSRAFFRGAPEVDPLHPPGYDGAQLAGTGHFRNQLLPADRRS